MAAACYILYSKKINKFYTGATHDNVEQRLKKHNEHSHGNQNYTAKVNDWEVFLFFEANDYPHAIRLDSYRSNKDKSVF